jgi:hypothetical protein
MADASSRCSGKYANAAIGSAEWPLRSVAYSFYQLQKKRQTADYDLSVTISSTSIALDILSVEEAFTSWAIITALSRACRAGRPGAPHRSVVSSRLVQDHLALRLLAGEFLAGEIIVVDRDGDSGKLKSWRPRRWGGRFRQAKPPSTLITDH